jgi:hypothetical protein
MSLFFHHFVRLGDAGHHALVVPSLDGKSRGRMYLTKYLRHVGWKCDDEALTKTLPRSDGVGLVMGASDKDVKSAAAAASAQLQMRHATDRLIRRT